MKLSLFLLGAIAAQEYEYDDFGNKKKRKNRDMFTSGETNPCGCMNVPRNSPGAFGNCNMTETELGNLPSNNKKAQRARVKIWWTCPADQHSGTDAVNVLFNARCKTLKKTPLAAPWPQTCGDISAQCKCEDGMAKFMTDVGASAKFKCTDDGRKHSTYRIWCDDDNDGEVGELELSAEGRVKCRGGIVRRAKGDLKNFECAADPAPGGGKKKKNKFFG